MKLQNTFLTLIILFVTFQFSFSQEKPKAELILEVGSIGGCENYSSSLDLLFTELSKDSDSVGYDVIQSKKGNVFQSIIYKEWLMGQFKLRQSDERLKVLNENRLIDVKGENSPELKIQLWKVPNGAEKPFKFDTNFDYILNLKKPLILFDINFDPGGLCLYLNHTKVFADFLKHNPNLNGNVVFYENSKSEFIKRKKDFLDELSGVSQNRIRFFRSSKESGYYEFWLVPQKKK